MLGLDLAIGALALRPGSGPAPAPAPSPTPTKVIFEGDSITFFESGPVSMANQWIAANPSVESENLSVGSARIRNNGGNSLDERRPALVSAASGHSVILCVLIGANDLSSTGAYPAAADWQNSLLAYLAAVRADVPGIKIGLGSILPLNETTYPTRAGHNARRATVNTWMRGQVGSSIDFLIPYGEHPVLGLDATAATGAFNDGLHPSSSGASYMLATLSAALDPAVAGAAGATPSAFAFVDFAASTIGPHYAETTVTGMGMGQSANASVTGSGDFARGAEPGGLSYGTGPVAVINGDILVSRVSRVAADTPLTQHTLAIGARSDTWDITNQAAPATTVWDQPFGRATLKYPTDREVKGPLTGEVGYNSASSARANKGYPVMTAGKYYFEIKPTAGEVGSNGGPWGVSVVGDTTNNNVRPGLIAGNGNQAITYRDSGIVYNNGAPTSGLPTYGTADTIGVAIDTGLDKVWFLKNGVSISGDPVEGTGGFALTIGNATEWRAGASMTRNEGHILNCGQDPFGNSPPSGYIAHG